MFARTPHLFHVCGGEESGTQRQIRHFDAPFAARGWLRPGVAVRTRQASIASRDYESHDVQAVASPFGGGGFIPEGNAMRFLFFAAAGKGQGELRLTILDIPDLARVHLRRIDWRQLTLQAVVANRLPVPGRCDGNPSEAEIRQRFVS